MATLHVPSQLRTLTDGQTQIEVSGRTVQDAVQVLIEQFPEMESRLCRNGQLHPSLQVSVDSVISTKGLYAPIRDDSQIHFIPALGGG